MSFNIISLIKQKSFYIFSAKYLPVKLFEELTALSRLPQAKISPPQIATILPGGISTSMFFKL